MSNKKLMYTIAGLGLLVAMPASAELSTNIGVASNYIWRGVTQTADDATVSGGLDYSTSGFYVGAWAANVSWADGYELDIYGGYSGEVSGFSYDLGVIAYLFPVGDQEADATEVYLTGGYGGFSAGAYFNVDSEAGGDDAHVYLTASYDHQINEDYGLSLYVGNFDFDGGNDGDYSHFGASLSKGDFSIAYDQADLDDADGDPRVTVAWSKTF